MKLVLDAGAIFSRIDADNAFTTGEVCTEIRDAESLQHLERLLASRKLAVRTPSPESLSAVRAAVSRTGDTLSVPDMSVIALARDISATVVTDDYGVQNVAASLGIAWSSAKTAGISRTLSWGLRCTGCRKRFPANYSGRECDVCGSGLVRARR